MVLQPSYKRYPYTLVSRIDIPPEVIANPSGHSSTLWIIDLDSEWVVTSKLPRARIQSLRRLGEVPSCLCMRRNVCYLHIISFRLAILQRNMKPLLEVMEWTMAISQSKCSSALTVFKMTLTLLRTRASGLSRKKKLKKGKIFESIVFLPSIQQRRRIWMMRCTSL